MTSEENNQGDEIFYHMDREENRLATFKDWPFMKDCECTPMKMAAAGFYHCPTEHEPDLVKCFVCLKELDGWEPSDDPWGEHKSHAPKCPFVVLNKAFDDMTLSEYLKLESARWSNKLTKTTEIKIGEFQKYAAEARKEMEHLCD